MGHVRRTAIALSAALGSAGLLVWTGGPAWAPTCGSSCGMYPKPPHPPTTVEQCKRGGWTSYTDAAGYSFPDQGACVSFVASRRATPVRPSAQFPGNPG